MRPSQGRSNHPVRRPPPPVMSATVRYPATVRYHDSTVASPSGGDGVNGDPMVYLNDAGRGLGASSPSLDLEACNEGPLTSPLSLPASVQSHSGSPACELGRRHSTSSATSSPHWPASHSGSARRKKVRARVSVTAPLKPELIRLSVCRLLLACTAGLGPDVVEGADILEPGQRLCSGPWTSRVCGHLWKVCAPSTPSHLPR